MNDPTPITLPSQDDMLKAVGRGIQAFVTVESGLAFVFASLLAPADRVLAIIAFNTVWQAEAKIRMINSVVEYKYPAGDPRRIKIDALLKRSRDRLPIRNKLAHYQVGFSPGALSIADVAKMGVALLPPITSPGHAAIVWGGGQPLKLNELTQFAELCNSLFLELVNLSNEIK
jgi:hypothetical protein